MRMSNLMKAAVLFASIHIAPLQSASAAQLVMFDQDHCPWCERWEEEIGGVYNRTDEGKRAPIRRVDIHSRLPSDLSHLKSGRFTPTFVLLDDSGQEVDRIRGYPGQDFFWGLLGEMLEKLPAKEHSNGAGGAVPKTQGN